MDPYRYLHARRRFTARRPWSPLTDTEWTALVPYVGDHFLRPARARGRPLGCDPRARFEAMLRAAVTDTPWIALDAGAGVGRGATVGRHFARLARAGLWSRLLEAVADPKAPEPLRAMEYWLCRLARRAMRLLGPAGLDLAQTLGLLTALPMLPAFLPDPLLSETAVPLVAGALADVLDALRDPHAPDLARLPRPGWLAAVGTLLTLSAGRRVWSKRLAPP